MRSILELKSIKDNKGQFQVASGTMWSLVGFILAVIIGLLVISLLVGGGFFTSGSDEAGAVGNLSANVTNGINVIGTKIPTLFTIIGMVIVLAIIGLLVVIVRKFGGFGGGGGNFAQ